MCFSRHAEPPHGAGPREPTGNAIRAIGYHSLGATAEPRSAHGHWHCPWPGTGPIGVVRIVSGAACHRTGTERWLGFSEQRFAFDKWNACRLMLRCRWRAEAVLSGRAPRHQASTRRAWRPRPIWQHPMWRHPQRIPLSPPALPVGNNGGTSTPEGSLSPVDDSEFSTQPSGGDAYGQRPDRMQEVRIRIDRLIKYLDLQVLLQHFLPQDLELHLRQAVAQAAVNAEAK